MGRRVVIGRPKGDRLRPFGGRRVWGPHLICKFYAFDSRGTPVPGAHVVIQELPDDPPPSNSHVFVNKYTNEHGYVKFAWRYEKDVPVSVLITKEGMESCTFNSVLTPSGILSPAQFEVWVKFREKVHEQ